MPELAEPPVIETNPAVEAAPKSLSQRYKTDLTAKRAENIETSPVVKEIAKTAVEKAAETKAEKIAETKKEEPKKSALDAALGEPVEKNPDAVSDEPAFDEKKADWPRAREVMGSQSAELKKLRAEVAKHSAPDPAIKSQIETLTRERDERAAENSRLRDAITALDVRYEPGHQAKFGKGKEELVSKAAGKLKAFGGNPDALTEALALPEGKLRSSAVKEALADLDPDDRVKVVTAIERVEALEEEEAAILKDPQQAWAKMTQQQEAQAQQAHEEAQKQKQVVFDRVTKELPTKHPLLNYVDATVEGADDWNNGIKGSLERSEHLRGPNATQEEITIASIKAGRYDFAESLVLTERAAHREEVTQLRAQLAKYEESEPGFVGKPKTPAAEYQSPAQKWRSTMDKKRAAEAV